MLGIKRKIIKKEKEIVNRTSIPNNKLNFFEKFLVLRKLKNELKEENSYKNIQAPITQYTNPESRLIWKKLIKYNPNNLGNWTRNKPIHLAAKLEKKLIEQFYKKYKINKKEFSAHLNSGGTESNLYAIWLGKEKLKKKYKLNELILLKTSLSHYSICKSAKIAELETKNIAINRDKWSIDINSLKEEINKQIEIGKKGFLISLTIGYTLTGTSDNINQIINLINKLKKENKNIAFFFWIDAAFSGFTKTFMENDFFPFKNKEIDLYFTDLHKFAGIPYSAGLVFCKRNLLKNIEKEIPYIGQKDTTISGSRSGISAIASWFSMQSLGQNGWQAIIDKKLKEKEKFIKFLQKEDDLKIITEKNSPQLCIIPKNKNAEKKLKKMDLNFSREKIKFTDKEEFVNFYKVFFLPDF